MRAVRQTISGFCNLVENDFRVPRNRKHITDNFFLRIEHSRSLYRDYRRLLRFYRVDVLNKRIGRWVKEHWGLDNLNECDRPKSTLIKTYTMHG